MDEGKEGENKKKTSFHYDHKEIVKIENLIDNMSKNKIKSKDDEGKIINGKNLGSIYFLKKNKNDGSLNIIEESNESKIPIEIKNIMVELLKKDIPYDGVRSQTEYKDSDGNLKIPGQSVFNKLKKEYLRDVSEKKRDTEKEAHRKEIEDKKRQKEEESKKKQQEKEKEKEAYRKEIEDKKRQKEEESKKKQQEKEKEKEELIKQKEAEKEAHRKEIEDKKRQKEEEHQKKIDEKELRKKEKKRQRKLKKGKISEDEAKKESADEISITEEKVEKPKEKKKKEKHGLFAKKSKDKKVEVQKITIDAKEIFSPDVDALKLNALKKLGFIDKDSWREIEFHPLVEPFAYTLIIEDTKNLNNMYVQVEIELNEDEKKKLAFINEVLKISDLDTDELESKTRSIYLHEKIDQIIDEYTIDLNDVSRLKINHFLEKDLLGLGKIALLMHDPDIEDISCDSSDVPVFIYHRIHGSLISNITFPDEDELSALIVKLAQKCGKHISIANPMLDATMPDGSRIQMTLSSEVTTKGSTFTIRKFKEEPFSPSDIIEFNTMSNEMMAYLWMGVQHGINALIAGGTASGKTSTLNAMALFIPTDSKIVSIEETREINLPHNNWIPGVARSGFGDVVGDKITGEIDMYDLMKAALRQRPEYILVGEIRGKEAYVLFQAMATGHTTYSTVHADSAKSLIHRLEGEPINIPRIMLQSLDVVCIQTISRVQNKRARRCKQILEIIDIDPSTKEILTNEVYHWDPVEDNFVFSGKSYVLERIRDEKNMTRNEMTKEIKNRSELLNWMAKKNIKQFKEVAVWTANYIDNPEKIMKKIKDTE